MLEKFFKLKENNTDVKTEVLAGLTTFKTMAYILAVNPSILSATGMDAQAILIATALASFVGTALMALFANYPFALAPGMGLNAYFAYDPWEITEGEEDDKPQGYYGTATPTEMGIDENKVEIGILERG